MTVGEPIFRKLTLALQLFKET